MTAPAPLPRRSSSGAEPGSPASPHRRSSLVRLLPGVPVLVALLFCGFMWIRSHFRYDHLARWDYRKAGSAWVADHLHVSSGKGGVRLCSARDTPSSPNETKYVRDKAGVEWYRQTYPDTKYPTLRRLTGFWGWLGFYVGPVEYNHSAAGGRTGTEILMPWWCPITLLLLLLAMFARPAIVELRRRRTAKGPLEPEPGRWLRESSEQKDK